MLYWSVHFSARSLSACAEAMEIHAAGQLLKVGSGAQAEPSFRAQLWRTVRTLFVVFVVMSGIGALFEDRGLPRGILNNPDMRPQFESKTKFADVKGVDEAKARTPSAD